MVLLQTWSRYKRGFCINVVSYRGSGLIMEVVLFGCKHVILDITVHVSSLPLMHATEANYRASLKNQSSTIQLLLQTVHDIALY